MFYIHIDDYNTTAINDLSIQIDFYIKIVLCIKIPQSRIDRSSNEVNKLSSHAYNYLFEKKRNTKGKSVNGKHPYRSKENKIKQIIL